VGVTELTISGKYVSRSAPRSWHRCEKPYQPIVIF
jgi:hypothetical protein